MEVVPEVFTRDEQEPVEGQRIPPDFFPPSGSPGETPFYAASAGKGGSWLRVATPGRVCYAQVIAGAKAGTLKISPAVRDFLLLPEGEPVTATLLRADEAVPDGPWRFGEAAAAGEEAADEEETGDRHAAEPANEPTGSDAAAGDA